MEQYTRQYTKKEMDEIGIDPGIQGLVKDLQFHGYNPIQSCAGHASELQDHYVGNERVTTLNPNTKYISLEKGLGDGWFNKERALKSGFTDLHDSDLIDTATGKRVPAISLYAGNPTAEHISNEEAKMYRRAA